MRQKNKQLRNDLLYKSLKLQYLCHMAGLYIHVPFCKQACHYCDFHFSTSLGTKTAIVLAIASEITIQRDYLSGDRIKTIYFGGGTPSLLTSEELNVIFESIY